MPCGENSDYKCGENLSHGEISPHEKGGEIMMYNFDVLVYLYCLVAKSLFYAIYAVLSLFTRFGVEKNRAKIFVCGEKRTNIRYVSDPSAEWRTIIISLVTISNYLCVFGLLDVHLSA